MDKLESKLTLKNHLKTKITNHEAYTIVGHISFHSANTLKLELAQCLLFIADFMVANILKRGQIHLKCRAK